ncbi:amino acid permease/ SLC12A domain-containing protein [Lasiosphaeria miniovina]|uniref:Amino acid permease/ SLC12A domain-containing protein n=1 Tax=Lasiosphaeria miniovina TaxID=1954250 RepID=A0AA40DNK8_9PEZI|nr:amino acid permease/ SLC12A domain-containing protein [Lasiosphaeria miniovina]KAK0710314.1 amino acid permease/ SLC12A domain-containing protein [Lasiosphaeria miniovina]
MAEKNFAEAEEGSSPPFDGIEERKQDRLVEGGAILGSESDVEQYGYVKRGLKSRHVQFIALGGTIGTGLFLGIGSAFTKAGPLSVLLGYAFTGLAIFAMMQSLGEMATWLPLPGAIPQFCARYVDDALGFAVGWNNWYASAITICAEISAAAVVIGYWEGAADINVAVWISILLILVIALNIIAVAIYGEAEFIFASVKIITIVGLLIMAFIVDLGGNPHGVRLGFVYWKDGNAMLEYQSTGDLGRFLGLFSTLINAAFSYGGVELVAVAAGEAENPRKNIPKAVRRVFWRILFFYVLGSLAIGVLVSSSDPHLLSAEGAGAARSPWVIGIQNAGITVLPSIINAVILTSATSSANAFLYTGSRYLYALAQNRQAPRFFLTCSERGVPYYAVGGTAIIGLLTYLSVQSDGGAAKAFEWFQNITTIASLFTWCSICVAYLRFYKALHAQGIDRDTLVFKSPFQPYTAWFCLAFFTLIIIFNGFAVFIDGNWDVSEFLASYIGIPIFFFLFAFWKLFKRTKWLSPTEADIFTGKAALDAEDDHWPDQKPRNIFERFWFWVA